MVEIDEELEKAKNLLHQTQYEVTKLKQSIWELLNYTPLFITVLDENFKIQLSNYHLATSLGFNNEQEIIGLNFIDFISDIYKEKTQQLLKKILSSSSSLGEIIIEIVGKSRNKILVRWFNLRVENDKTHIIAVGVPTNSNRMTEDSLRAYYRDVVEHDKTVVESIKLATKQQFLHSYSENKNLNFILGEYSCRFL